LVQEAKQYDKPTMNEDVETQDLSRGTAVWLSFEITRK